VAEQREAASAVGWMAVLLDGVGGYVDAVGFLLLFQLFAANMSGNSILLGVNLGQGHWDAALRQALPIPLFVAGVVLGLLLCRALAARGRRSTIAAALALEALLLATFAVYGSRFLQAGALRPAADWQTVLLTALITVPMGLQNAALRHVGSLSVRTTFVTGTLASLAETAVAYLGPPAPSARAGNASRARLLGGMWAAYVGGAALGAAAVTRWALGALTAPLLVLAALTVLDLARPTVPPDLPGGAGAR